MEKRLVVAVSGKGGVGKTTLTALMVKILGETDGRSVLVIDANPDSNLPDVLGVSYSKTVGMATDELRKSMEQSSLPPEVSKESFLESKIFELLEETPNFDLLVMGRGEGEGCYCPVNAFLTRIIDTLSRNYDLTLMDTAAGLEHLSRRTDRDVDIMIVVTDPSFMGFQTARRIKEIAEEVHISFKKIYLVGNRFPPEMEGLLKDEAKKIGIEHAGRIPEDDNIFRSNLAGKSVLDLPPESPAVAAVKKILAKTGLLET